MQRDDLHIRVIDTDPRARISLNDYDVLFIENQRLKELLSEANTREMLLSQKISGLRMKYTGSDMPDHEKD